MNPGATTRPSALMVRVADALHLPTPTILPFCTATSAWKEGPPEPSTTRPPLMSRSYAAIALPLFGPRYDEACLTHTWSEAKFSVGIPSSGSPALLRLLVVLGQLHLV